MGDDRGRRRARRWPVRRLFPLLATAGLLVIAMGSSVWWGPHMAGKTAWALPHDLWRTLDAASRLLHLNLGGLYTRPTGLVSFPGAAVILIPIAAVIDAAGFSLAIPGPHNSQPAAWLLAGPYSIAVSSAALFAADALAERLGVSRPKRAALAAAGAVALWSVAADWGHPEDAVAVALFLYGVLALADGRPQRSAWLAGAAIAVQPLVLLALPFILVIIQPRALAGYLARAATPGALALGVAAAANFRATFRAMTSQPNWPGIDHPTPWTALAVHLSNGAVAAGPARVAAIAVSCGCAFVAGRRWRADGVIWPLNPITLAELLWWIAVAFALRTAFEPVMVAYYIWPAIAVALITATSGWLRLIGAGAGAVSLTALAQLSWHGPYAWWSLMVAGLASTLWFARVTPQRMPLVRARGSAATDGHPAPAGHAATALRAHSSAPPGAPRPGEAREDSALQLGETAQACEIRVAGGFRAQVRVGGDCLSQAHQSRPCTARLCLRAGQVVVGHALSRPWRA